MLTPSTLIDEIPNSRNFDMILINFGPSVEDPDISIYVHSRNTVKGGINGWNYRNPDLDKLLDDATATIDRSKRKDIYARIQNVMAEEVAVMPLVVPFSTLAVSKRLQAASFTVHTGASVRPWMNNLWVTDGK